MSASVNNLTQKAQNLTDKAADLAQTGVERAKESASGVTDALANSIAGAHDQARPLIRKAGARAQTGLSQGFDAIGDLADQARDLATNATDSIVSYTKKNPVKALAIAAASGALLYAALKTYRSYRD